MGCRYYLSSNASWLYLSQINGELVFKTNRGDHIGDDVKARTVKQAFLNTLNIVLTPL